MGVIGCNGCCYWLYIRIEEGFGVLNINNRFKPVPDKWVAAKGFG